MNLSNYFLLSSGACHTVVYKFGSWSRNRCRNSLSDKSDNAPNASRTLWLSPLAKNLNSRNNLVISFLLTASQQFEICDLAILIRTAETTPLSNLNCVSSPVRRRSLLSASFSLLERHIQPLGVPKVLLRGLCILRATTGCARVVFIFVEKKRVDIVKRRQRRNSTDRVQGINLR